MQALPPIRPHDLLWIADPRDLILREPAPAWATSDWLVQAPVVVRREHTHDDAHVPVGLRGMSRGERAAGYVDAERVVRRLTPEAVADSAAQTPALPDADLPCLRTLTIVRPRLDALGMAWGVTGSAGFAIATGLPVLRESSDLDLLVRAPHPLANDTRTALEALVTDTPARLDIQIDTGLGGFALLEWIATRARVLLKTSRGPVLVDDPWNAHHVDAALTRANAVGQAPESR